MIEWPTDFFKANTLVEGNLIKSLTFSGHKLQGRMKYQGMDISIENKKGSVRKGTDADGKKWETKMTHPYGYIRNTVNKKNKNTGDKEHLDVFIGPNNNSSKVFIVRQVDDNKKYDEDKVLLGFNSMKEAKSGYLSNYNTSKYFNTIKQTTIDKFKEIAIKKKLGPDLIKFI